MLIDARKIDDFKTERKDLLPPLPMTFRLVPILFYMSVLFLVVVGSVAMWHARAASQRYQALASETAALQQQIQQSKGARDQLDERTLEAMDLENWVLASMPVQPLVVEIHNSIQDNSSIVSLTVERDPETPSQLKLDFVLQTDSEKQLDAILEAVKNLGYRILSPTQSMEKDNIKYRATLGRETRRRSVTPEARKREVVQP